jgi:hypothetical protein
MSIRAINIEGIQCCCVHKKYVMLLAILTFLKEIISSQLNQTFQKQVTA